MGPKLSTERCDIIGCCHKDSRIIDSAPFSYTDSPRVPNEFDVSAPSGNVTAIEGDMGESSIGSLVLFQRAQESIKIRPVQSSSPLSFKSSGNESVDSNLESERISDLLQHVRKEQEALESLTLTEQSKLQEEREELEKEKRVISALLLGFKKRSAQPTPVKTEAQQTIVWSTVESKVNTRECLSEVKGGRMESKNSFLSVSHSLHTPDSNSLQSSFGMSKKGNSISSGESDLHRGWANTRKVGRSAAPVNLSAVAKLYSDLGVEEDTR